MPSQAGVNEVVCFFLSRYRGRMLFVLGWFRSFNEENLFPHFFASTVGFGCLLIPLIGPLFIEHGLLFSFIFCLAGKVSLFFPNGAIKVLLFFSLNCTPLFSNQHLPSTPGSVWLFGINLFSPLQRPPPSTLLVHRSPHPLFTVIFSQILLSPNRKHHHDTLPPSRY